MNPRKQIRNAVADILKTAREDGSYWTAAGATVEAGRDLPFGRDDFENGIIVYANDEDIDPLHQHEGGQRYRTARLEVQCYAVGDEGGERADDMAWQVEEALRAFPDLGALVERCNVVRVESAFADNGEDSLWVTSVLCDVSYWTHVIVPPGGTTPVTVLAGTRIHPVGPELELEDFEQVAPCEDDLP